MTKTTHAVVVDSFGGPEVLDYRSVPLPDPGPGEALIRHTAIGLNFIDTYHRSGLYPLDPPITPGTEAAGIVEAVGGGVTVVAPGDRVACRPVRSSTGPAECRHRESTCRWRKPAASIRYVPAVS